MRRGRLDTLTGMRAIAAGLVFLDHVPGLLSGGLARGEARIGSQGAAGVTFFFVLSGFVLTWSAREGDTPRAFFRRRVARILPAYTVACVAGIVLTVVFMGGAFDWGPVSTSLLLLQSWVPSKNYYFAYNGVGWSLSDEAFFYLLFPLVIPALRSLSRAARRGLQLTLVTAIGGLAAVSPFIWKGSYLVNHFPPARFAEFVLGCTLAIDGSRAEWIFTRVRLSYALLLAGAVYLVAGLPVGGFRNVALPIIPVLLLLTAGAQVDIAGAGGLLASRTAIWLGEISYCFYLVHQLVIKVLIRLLEYAPDIPGDGLVWAVVALGLSVAAAWLLHAIIEVPLDRRLRKKPTVGASDGRSAGGGELATTTSAGQRDAA